MMLVQHSGELRSVSNRAPVSHGNYGPSAEKGFNDTLIGEDCRDIGKRVRLAKLRNGSA
jgi:hypothetical protein